MIPDEYKNVNDEWCICDYCQTQKKILESKEKEMKEKG